MSATHAIAVSLFASLLLFANGSCAPSDGTSDLAKSDDRRTREAPSPTRLVRFQDSEFEKLLHHATAVFASEERYANRLDNPLLVARAQWLHRYGRCADRACRASILAEASRRLNFGLGRSRDRFPGFPWRTGAFMSPPGQDYRRLLVLPLEDGRIMAAITTIRPGWDCQLVAAGRIDGNGNAVMTVLEEDARFLLRTRTPGEILVEPVSADIPETYCHGSEVGPYRESRRLLRQAHGQDGAQG